MSAPWRSKPLRPVKDDPITPEVRRLVKARSKGLCELCGGAGEHLHHRQLRRGGDHSAANLVDLCNYCHRRIHGHVAWSTEHGWLVSQYGRAGATPIEIGNAWFTLTEVGSRVPVTGPVNATRDSSHG